MGPRSTSRRMPDSPDRPLHECGAQPSLPLAEPAFPDRAVVPRAVSRMVLAGQLTSQSDASERRATIKMVTAVLLRLGRPIGTSGATSWSEALSRRRNSPPC